MSHRLSPAVCAALLAGLLGACSSTPPAPDWQLNTQGALRDGVLAYLTGNDRVADAEFTRARAEIAPTGRADLLARAELVRCAAQVASVAADGCPAYQALAADAAPPERAYAQYLGGPWQGLAVADLPPQHRGVAAAGSDAGLAAIEDPLARLVAAGALFQAGRLSPAGLAVASDTASAQGWRRPLLAWLTLQARRARDAGQADVAARLERRIALVGTGGVPAR